MMNFAVPSHLKTPVARSANRREVGCLQIVLPNCYFGVNGAHQFGGIKTRPTLMVFSNKGSTLYVLQYVSFLERCHRRLRYYYCNISKNVDMFLRSTVHTWWRKKTLLCRRAYEGEKKRKNGRTVALTSRTSPTSSESRVSCSWMLFSIYSSLLQYIFS